MAKPTAGWGQSQDYSPSSPGPLVRQLQQMAVVPMVSVHLSSQVCPLLQVSWFLFLHQASSSHPPTHSISVLSVHSLIPSIMHVPTHPGSSWHAYTPWWAVGTAGSKPANVKPRSQARISRSRIPGALWEEERKRAHPTRSGPARCFFLRCGQPKHRWAEGERTGAQRAILGAGKEHYANEMQIYANHRPSVSILSYTNMACPPNLRPTLEGKVTLCWSSCTQCS